MSEPGLFSRRRDRLRLLLLRQPTADQADGRRNVGAFFSVMGLRGEQ
jgi:hypothetical protein